MWNGSRTKGRITGTAAFAILMGALVVAGCGTDEEKTSRTQPTESATPAVAPPIDTESPAQEETVATVSEPAKEVTYNEAEAAFSAKRYDEAVQLFTLYSERARGNPWGHYMLGLSAWKAGKLETAEAAFGQALAIDSGHVKSHVNLTRVLLDGGRPAEALVSIDKALALDAESGAAHRLKGRACHDLGRTEEAVAEYRQAIQIDREDAWSMNNLAFILIEEGRCEDALAPLARAVELRSNVALFFNNLGMALELTGRFRAAKDAYASATTADPSYAKAAANLERVAGVLEDPAVTPVDLASLARGFEAEIGTWTASSYATAPSIGADALPESAPPEVRTTSGGKADSTVSDQPQ